jgi:dimethylamine monooxygenase subunit A
LSDAPLYTPFEAPYRMSMGLLALPPDEWIEIDEELVPQLREKRALAASRPDEVFRALPGSEAAQAEVLQILARHLVRLRPDLYRLEEGGRLATPLGEIQPLDGLEAPLECAGRLVQEDLCLMERGAEGWVLTAGSVSFPTRWRLADKIGKPLAAIHDPVPGFAEKLAAAVARFFDNLKVERPVWRLNWSLLDDPALFQPTGHGRIGRDDSITAENAGERLWLRVERQTLRRLPATDAVAFTIRVHRWPLARLAAKPEAAARLKGAIETLPAALARYNSIPVFGEAVTAWLARAACAGPTGGAMVPHA